MATPILRERVIELRDGGAQLVEVLDHDEYERLHIAGAVNIPLAELGPRAGELDARRPVVTYCFDERCDLSARAAHRLAHLGFAETYDYVGSKADWFANGLPVEGREASLPRIPDVAVMPPTCRPDEPLAALRERIGEWDVCIVIDEANVVLGLVHAKALSRDGCAGDVMKDGPATYRPDVSIEEMAERLAKNPEPRVLVTNADGTLVGIATTEDVERAAKSLR